MNKPLTFCLLTFCLIAGGPAYGAIPEPMAIYPGEKATADNKVAAIYSYPAPAEKNTGFTVIVCPGGGYRTLCISYEGHEVAEWFNSIGVNAVVLRYRLPADGFEMPAPLNDLQRTIRTVRRKCSGIGGLPDRIGVMGFSAGGHLAAMSTVHWDAGNMKSADPVERVSCRPDFSVLCYPVIRAGKRDSKRYPDVDGHVNASTPPAFIYQCTTDEKVAPENSLAYYQACRKAGVSVELHLFADGMHGGGMAIGDPLPRREWHALLENWIRSLDPAVQSKAHPIPLETKAWQKRIDDISSAGGGTVSVPAGRHLVGGLFLKDNVELHLEKGAVLEGSPNEADYEKVRFPGSKYAWMAVITALGATNVAVTGEGTVFGNGSAWPQPNRWGGVQEADRPKGMLFDKCARIRLEDFTLKDAACWGIHLKECDGVVARRVKIDSHANVNNDGFDIEAKNSLFEDCFVDADDDAYCFKSDNPLFAVENVAIRNCVGASNCNVYKFGTGTRGTMRNIIIENCTSIPPARSIISQCNGQYMPPLGTEFHWERRGKQWVDCADTLSAIVGIAVECVDGGIVRDITIRNMNLLGVRTPIFVRGGTRSKQKAHGTCLENVTIENVTAEADSLVANSITGVEGCRPSNIVLRNVNVKCRGAGENAAERTRAVPEVPARYPEATMFDCMLPAWGLYIRHADGVKLENVNFTLFDGDTDRRDCIVRDDAR